MVNAGASATGNTDRRMEDGVYATKRGRPVGSRWKEHVRLEPFRERVARMMDTAHRSTLPRKIDLFPSHASPSVRGRLRGNIDAAASTHPFFSFENGWNCILVGLSQNDDP